MGLIQVPTPSTLPTQTGNSGKFLTTNGTDASWGSAGLNWTSRFAGPGTMNKVEYNGSNLWVAVGSSGQLYTSPDGTTWTSRTSGFGSNAIRDVAFGNGLWVAVGGNGTITTSTDGTTWTARTANMSTNTISAVKYANSIWVAVGGGGGTTNTGGITYSTDGITWTRKSQSITIADTYNDVVWNGTNWIVVTGFSTNNYLYASTPSGTWTAGHTGSNDSIFRIFWDGTRHITVESNPYSGFRYSTSTTLGTTTQYNSVPFAGGSGLGWSYYYNSQIYVSNGIYYQTFIPASTSSVSVSPATIQPGTAATRDGSGSPNLSYQATAIWAGSQGIILANNSSIYTSF